MRFDEDAGACHRAAIGLVALANDFTIEPELSRFLQIDGVAVYASRIAFPDDTTVRALAGMEKQISSVTDLINKGVPLDVVAYGCTSGTMAIGPENVTARIHEVRPGVKVTDPITAGLAGLRALKLRRIAVLTPYIDEVNQMVEAFIGARGFDIGARASFKIRDSITLCRVTPESIRTAALEVGRSDVDGLFISCTAMRVSPVIAEIERALGKPVVASNQAIAWHALRLSGCNDTVSGFGKLLESPL